MPNKLGVRPPYRSRRQSAFPKPCLEPLEDRCLLSGDLVVELPIPPGFGHPMDITAGPDGNFWFTEATSGIDFATSNYVGRITPAGQVTEFSIPEEGMANLNGGALRITAGPDGNLWFTEFTPAMIARLTVSGQITEFRVPSATASLVGITPGPDGNLWFTEVIDTGAINRIGQIGRITPTGQVTEFRIPATGDSEPDGITAGRDGNLWFADYGAHAIGRITPQGAITLFPITAPNSFPGEITTGADGNLWFTGAGTDSMGHITIGRITPQGAVTSFPLPSGSHAYGITAGPDGNIWFTEPLLSNCKVAEITPGGVVTEFATPTPQSNPTGITAGPDGNIWFAETLGPLASPTSKLGKVILTGPTANQHYVERLYTDLLHRAADPGGLATWTELLNRGVSRAEVAFAIEQSSEYRTDEVEALYGQLLGRPADPTGLAASLNFLAAGGSIKQLEAMLLGSDEYFARRSGGDTTRFLQAVYQDVLHRPIDSSGLQTWGEALATGASRAAVASAILASPESDGDEVDALYQQFLHRAADPAGRAFFVAALESGLPLELAQALITGSAEYFIEG